MTERTDEVGAGRSEIGESAAVFTVRFSEIVVVFEAKYVAQNVLVLTRNNVGT